MKSGIDIAERLGRGVIYDAAESHELSKADILEAKAEIERLRDAATVARDYLQGDLDDMLECSCGRDRDGKIGRANVDEHQLPMIETLEHVLATVEMALSVDIDQQTTHDHRGQHGRYWTPWSSLK